MHSGPTLISELDQSAIRSILARNTVGRLAFVRGEQIDVLPIQYVYHGGALYGRTAPGGKLGTIDPLGTTVAFEVDEIDSAHRWRSVLAHGTFRLVDRETTPDEWVEAFEIVRRLHRTAMTDDDPRPDRTEIFRIDIRNATGRATV